MKGHLIGIVCGLIAATAFSATPDAAAVRRAKEQLALFKPDAARRAMADLKSNPKYDWAKHNAAVEALIAKEAAARAALGANAAGTAAPHNVQPISKEEAVALVEAYRAAMLANPVLDFDKILCVHRKIGNPRGAFGGRGSGMTGLNAENHMVAPRTGFPNEIVVLSNLRGTPTYTELYKPADGTSVVRDLDLDFDASRILFTQYKGTNNLFGVYEIELNDEMVKSAASQPLNGAEHNLKPEGRFNHLKGEARFNLQAKLISPEDGHYDIQWWD